MKIIKNFFDNVPNQVLKKRKKIAQPNFIQPMLATLTNKYFSDPNWLYEHKLDGERCLAIKKNGKIFLKSRNNREINNEYPELVNALLQQKSDNFIIDGEIVAVDKKGSSEFQLLQGRINLKENQKISVKEKEVPIEFYIFDLVYVHGYDIRQFPLINRKEILEKLFEYNYILKYTKHKLKDGIKFFKEACLKKWEGLIAKRINSQYVGKRSKDWLKFKCIDKQELVIGGYTQPKGSRQYFGALLVGYYEKGKLIYAGKVGTGYTVDTLAMLFKLMHKLEISKCPFTNYNESQKDIHWLKPKLVAEFQFAQWTKENKLRVGRYKGLRTDKDAKAVVKEVSGI